MVDIPRTDKLIDQLTMARAVVVAATAKVSDLQVACYQAHREHEKLAKKILAAVKKAEGHVIAERTGALSRYDGVLRSVLEIVNIAGERSTRPNNALT